MLYAVNIRFAHLRRWQGRRPMCRIYEGDLFKIYFTQIVKTYIWVRLIIGFVQYTLKYGTRERGDVCRAFLNSMHLLFDFDVKSHQTGQSAFVSYGMNMHIGMSLWQKFHHDCQTDRCTHACTNTYTHTHTNTSSQTDRCHEHCW